MYTTQQLSVSSRVIFVFNTILIKESEMYLIFGGEIKKKIHNK